MAMDEIYLDKLCDDIYKCFEAKLIREFQSDGSIEEFKSQEYEDEDDLFDEIRDTIYEWYESLYTDCAQKICLKNADKIFNAVKGDERFYNEILTIIEDESGYLPDDDAWLAYYIVLYGFIDINEGYDGWMDYAIHDATRVIYNMVV